MGELNAEDENTGGGGHGGDGSDNVVHMPTLAERDRMRREAEKLEKKLTRQDEPFINLPPATKYILAVFVLVHLAVHLLLNEQWQEWVFLTLGFIPGRFTGTVPFEMAALVTPLSHMLLHGSWLHLIMNGVMMMAFGTGVERWIGPRKMIIFFVICGLFGIAAHFALNPFSVYPVIGASGALSGLFAAALVMINRGKSDLGGRFGMLPFIILWIGISVAFGMMGSPDGSPIAWAAHVGGFLGGFAAIKIMRI